MPPEVAVDWLTQARVMPFQTSSVRSELLLLRLRSVSAMWSNASNTKAMALVESADAKAAEIRSLLSGKIHPGHAQLLKQALKRLTEYTKRAQNPDQRFGLSLGRYVSNKAAVSPLVAAKELSLLSTHIRKTTECIDAVGKDPSVFAAWRFLRHQSARTFWTERCGSDTLKVKWPQFEKVFKECYGDDADTRVLMWYLCLSKRYTVEDDHVHLYDFAILTDQRGVYTTYIYLQFPHVLPTKGSRDEVLRCTLFFKRLTMDDTVAKRDPWLRQFFDIAFTINKWYSYNGGLLIEFAEEMPDVKSLYEDSPRPRLGDRLVAYKPAECTVDETFQAEKRDQDAKNKLLTKLNACIEEERLQLRHETSSEMISILQANLLLKEHHKRMLSGTAAAMYHSASTYKRSDWISGEELSRSFARNGAKDAPPAAAEHKAPVLQPIVVSESVEVTLVITPKSSPGTPKSAASSPLSTSRRERKKEKRDKRERAEREPQEDWGGKEGSDSAIGITSPAAAATVVALPAPAAKEEKPETPKERKESKLAAVSFANDNKEFVSKKDETPNKKEEKSAGVTFANDTKDAAATSVKQEERDERKERKEKKQSHKHFHSGKNSKRGIKLDASSPSPTASPGRSEVASPAPAIASVDAPQPSTEKKEKEKEKADVEAIAQKPRLVSQPSRVVLAGRAAAVQFACKECGCQNVVSLEALGVGLPKAAPAPAAASGNTDAAVLVRQSSKGVRRLSEFIAADVIRAQRVVRQWLMRKRWGRLVSDVKNHSSSLYARLRNETLKEIIQSEESYLSHLIAVVRVYIAPLSDGAARASAKRIPLMSRTEIFDIFSNFELIADFHIELLQELKERAQLYPTITHLGDIFVRMAPLMKLYSSYIRMYDRSSALLSDLRKNRPALATWLNARAAEPDCKGQPLDSYLIMPVQRLPRYQMLLQQLLKYTAQEHVDYANLTKAIERVKAVIEDINVRAREEQDRHQMQMVGKRLHETLDDDETRKLLYETTVTWSEVKNTKDPKEARLFLFNNLLLLVRARKGVMATLFESNKNKNPEPNAAPDEHLKIKLRIAFNEMPQWEPRDQAALVIWTSQMAEGDHVRMTFLDHIHRDNVVRCLQGIAASGSLSHISLVPTAASPRNERKASSSAADLTLTSKKSK